MRRPPSSFAILAAAGVLALTLSASAQPGGDTAAEAVFAQGLEKFDRGDYIAACPLLARAVELSTTEALGGMLTLAECYEHTDRPASAWALYKHVAARAVLAKQAERAETARRAADRLEPTLPRVLFVNKGDAAHNLRVRHEKDTVPSDVWNVPFPVDPGSQVFTFEADGREAKTVTVEIPKGPSRTEVSAPKLFTLIAPSRRATPRKSPASEAESSFGGLGIAGIVIGVAGLGAVGASLGVILDAKSKYDDAVAEDCNGDATRCDNLAGLDDARAQGDIASALFGVGTAVATAGIILVIVDFAWDPEKKPGQEARVWVAPTIGGASATWEF